MSNHIGTRSLGHFENSDSLNWLCGRAQVHTRSWRSTCMVSVLAEKRDGHGRTERMLDRIAFTRAEAHRLSLKERACLSELMPQIIEFG